MTKHASDYDRIDNDLYCTPAWVVEWLMLSPWRRRIEGAKHYDPCCGQGHIITALRDLELIAYGHDIVSINGADAKNFFRLRSWHEKTTLFTNPPFSCADGFIWHGLNLTRPTGDVMCLLLPMEFDAAKTRRWIFKDHPAFIGKMVITKRIRWANLVQKEAGPKGNHAWFLWDWGKQREPGEFPITDYLFEPDDSLEQ